MKKIVFLTCVFLLNVMAYGQDGIAYWSNNEGWKFDFDADGTIDLQFPNRTADKEITEVFVLDANGDGAFDLCEVDRTGGLIKWHFYYNNGSNEFIDTQSFEFGVSEGDKALSGDFNADGIGDIAIRRDNEYGLWWIMHFMGMAPDVNVPFGINEEDKLLSGDFNNDGVTDVAVYSKGAWKVSFTPDNMPTLATADIDNMQFGTSFDIPVIADFDGDGFADMGLCSVDDEEISVNLHNAATKPENNGYSKNGRGSFDKTIQMPAGINPTHVCGIRKQHQPSSMDRNLIESADSYIAPNPVNSGISCFYSSAMEIGNSYQLEVVSISGQLIKSEIIVCSDNRLQFSVSGLNTGTYLVRVSVNGEYVVRKLFVI